VKQIQSLYVKQNTVSLREAKYSLFTWSKIQSLYVKQNTVSLHEAKYSLFTWSKIQSLYLKQNTVSLREAKYGLFTWSKIQSLYMKQNTVSLREAKYSLLTWSKIQSLDMMLNIFITIFKVIVSGIWKLMMKINQNMSCVMWVDYILISYNINLMFAILNCYNIHRIHDRVSLYHNNFIHIH